VVVYARRLGDERAIIALNASDADTEVTLPSGGP